jgi:hypothetical protein
MAMFITSIDQIYGPIMMLYHDNCLVKHISWTAFEMKDLDWIRVINAQDILRVHTLISMQESRLIISCSNRIQIRVRITSPSRSNQPSGVCSLPLKNSRLLGRSGIKYALYKDALINGLTKIGKYYSRLDEKPSSVLGLGKHFLSCRCLLIQYLYSASPILQACLHKALMGWSQGASH